MSDLNYTLIGDGTSDKALLPILTWLLRKLGVKVAIQPKWANLGQVPNPPKKLEDKITTAINIFGKCDILFIHRDAEREPQSKRVAEIRTAEMLVSKSIQIPPIVCVVPVRMTEAWLLFNEIAIRQAASNPKGRQELNLPKINEIEGIADPKKRLIEILTKASSDRSRRRKEERIPIARLAELIDDFEPLRKLSAFQELEQELKSTLISHQWISMKI
jgi:Domain of unknown function (DUF4276)